MGSLDPLPSIAEELDALVDAYVEGLEDDDGQDFSLSKEGKESKPPASGLRAPRSWGEARATCNMVNEKSEKDAVALSVPSKGGEPPQVKKDNKKKSIKEKEEDSTLC
eukprot:s4196_g6.t1